MDRAKETQPKRKSFEANGFASFPTFSTFSFLYHNSLMPRSSSSSIRKDIIMQKRILSSLNIVKG